MYEYNVPPPPPAPPRRDSKTMVIAVAVGVALVLIIGLLVANLVKASPAPAAAPTTTVAPTPEPTVSPAPATIDPVIVDPYEDAMVRLHEVVYVQQFCNMVDRSGIPFFDNLIDMGIPWRTNSIGSAWVAAQNKTGYSIEELATEFYRRYC